MRIVVFFKTDSKKAYQPSMKIPTLINSSSKINGELIFTTEVRIDGEVFGKVESDKSVIIGAEGYVKGFLRAKDLFVFGRLEGNIVVSGHTVLHESASVFGNLYTKVFEVKEGAVITARVVTYDKLEALDEAQIYLAEEMIKIEPGRRQIPNYGHGQTSFKDSSDNVDLIQVPVYNSDNLLINEPIPADSGDILAKMMEHNTVLEDTKIMTPKEVINVSEESIISPVAAEVLPELVEMVLLEEGNVAEDEDIFTLFSPWDEMGEDQTVELLNPIDTEVNPAPAPGQNYLLEFDFDSNGQDSDEPNSASLFKSLSIADCLGEPVKEDSLKLKKGKKKVYSSDVTLIPQTVRKNKVYSLSGFEELRNLLIPSKYHDLKSAENLTSAEKKNIQEKHITKKANDTEPGNKSKGSEKSEFFLNDAIRQLPIDDYSSLFN